MLAPVVSAVMRRIIVDHFDIADQPCARVGAFDQIVAEQSVARKALIQNLVQSLDFEDSFAGVNSFAVEVLVDVGSRARVDVEPVCPE